MRVYGASHLLYMSPVRDASKEDWCIFDKVGCTIDFAAAREKNELVELFPYAHTPTKNRFEHEFSGECWEIRDWSRKGSEGFMIWNGLSKSIQFVEVTYPNRLKLVHTISKAEENYWGWQG